MGASFQAKDPGILSQQLQVQELVVRFEDKGLYSVSGNVVSVQVSEPVQAVVAVLYKRDSGSPVLSALTTASLSVVSSSVITMNLGVAFASNDVLIIRYIVNESV